MVDVMFEAMPNDTGIESFQRLDIARRRMELIRSPGEINVHTREAKIDVFEPFPQSPRVEIVEIGRPIVEDQVQGRQKVRFKARGLSDRDQCTEFGMSR